MEINIKSLNVGYVITVDGKTMAKDTSESVKAELKYLFDKHILSKIDKANINELNIKLEITHKP